MGCETVAVIPFAALILLIRLILFGASTTVIAIAVAVKINVVVMLTASSARFQEWAATLLPLRV